MIEPIEIDLRVDRPPAETFAIWTGRIDLWWPRGHSRSGDPRRIEIEPGVGGRILEHGRDGAMHQWGRITVWAPPDRLGFAWHIYGTPDEATDVEVTFGPEDAGTRVRLVHTGWERLEATRPDVRDRNAAAWRHVLHRLAEACEPEEAA